MMKRIGNVCSKKWILEFESYSTYAIEKGIEDLVAMLWSAITLEGINIMVFHHTSHGAILWRKFK